MCVPAFAENRYSANDQENDGFAPEEICLVLDGYFVVFGENHPMEQNQTVYLPKEEFFQLIQKYADTNGILVYPELLYTQEVNGTQYFDSKELINTQNWEVYWDAETKRLRIITLSDMELAEIQYYFQYFSDVHQNLSDSIGSIVYLNQSLFDTREEDKDEVVSDTEIQEIRGAIIRNMEQIREQEVPEQMKNLQDSYMEGYLCVEDSLDCISDYVEEEISFYEFANALESHTKEYYLNGMKVGFYSRQIKDLLNLD